MRVNKKAPKPSTAASADDCDPNKWFDSSGRNHFWGTFAGPAPPNQTDPVDVAIPDALRA
jgi:hypothetical protein